MPTFEKLITHYPSLSQEEGETIASILNSPDIQSTFQKVEHRRKMVLGVYALTLVGCAGIVSMMNVWENGPIFLGTIFVLSTIIALIALKSKDIEQLKSMIIERFFLSLGKKASFSAWDAHAFSIEWLVDRWLLSSYDRVDSIEDSIRFDHEANGRSIHIQWMELTTSEERTQDKKKTRVTTNHCYLLKGCYDATRFNISTDVLIRSDTADSRIVNLLAWIIPTVIAFFVLGGEQIVPDPIIASMCSIAFWTIAWYCIRKLMDMNRIKLENVAFESLFDVVSKDPIMSRMILTPAFMDRIVEFVKQSAWDYEFLFRGDTLYIKKDLQSNFGGYMELNILRNASKNAGVFIEWYVNIKELIGLISDTGVLVFAKTDVSTQRVIPTESTSNLESPVKISLL